jgi:NAD(P)-dependent dehydrogenase (short-subunit alcohol dehydrogenase family)
MTHDDFDPRRVANTADALEGRVIAITGATGGYGRALALDCARHGAEVILIGRNVKKLEAVHAEIVAAKRGDGCATPEPVIAPLDLEKAIAKDFDTLADAIAARFGRLDGLVHNAAMLGEVSPIAHQDVPTWVRVMHVNVTAPFALTQVLLPQLLAAKDGSIVCIASAVGRRARAYWGAYAVSKHALEGFAGVLADELENTNVRVNTLNPGRMRTTMRRAAYPSEDAETLPMPEVATGACIALLGPVASGITGRRFDAQ